MKQYIYILIFLSQVTSLISQNIEPGPIRLTFPKNGTDTTVYMNARYFPQNQFITSFQWGARSKTIQAMDMNCGQNPSCCPFDEDLAHIPNPPINTIIGTGGYFPILSSCFRYEPTLLVSDPDILLKRQYDTTNAIWGFGHIDGKPLRANYVDYNRLFSSFPEAHSASSSEGMEIAYIRQGKYAGILPKVKNPSEGYREYCKQEKPADINKIIL